MASEVNFTIGLSELKRVLSQLEPVFKGGIDGNPKILFDVQKENIVAKATNGEAFVKTSFNCEDKTAGVFVVNGEVFSRIIKKGNDKENVKLKASNNVLSIEAGRYNYEISLIETNSEYFEAPDLQDAKEFAVQAQDLKSAIAGVSCCIDPAKQHLNCVMIHSNQGENDKIYVVATDGMRLGVAERKANTKEQVPNLMVPKKAADYILTMIGESQGEIAVKYTENLVQFSNGSSVYTSRLLDTAFPKYQAVIPTANNKILETKCSDMKEAIDNLASVLEMAYRMRLAISKDKVLISCEESGSNSRGEIEATYSDAETIEIVCNYRLLNEILAKIPSNIVRIQIADASTPLLIRAVDDETIRYVFMPFVS